MTVLNNIKRISLFLSFTITLLVYSSANATGMCERVGEMFPGEWRFGEAHTFSFIAGEPKIILDGEEKLIETCLITRRSAMFYIDRMMVNINITNSGRPNSIYIDNRFEKVKQAPPVSSSNKGIPDHINPADHFHAFPSARFPELYQTMKVEELTKGFGSAAYMISPLLKIEARECNQVNAFYTPATTTVTICYEYLDQGDRVIERTYRAAPISVKANMKTGILSAVLFHEIGHAVIHLKEVPLLGGEEDAADRFAYVLMHRIAASDPQRMKDMVYGNLAFTWSFRQDVLTKILTGPMRYMDEHPITEQRYYNLVCLAYGSEPQLFNDLRVSAGLSDNRANRCEHEFRQAQAAVMKVAN